MIASLPGKGGTQTPQTRSRGLWRNALCYRRLSFPALSGLRRPCPLTVQNPLVAPGRPILWREPTWGLVVLGSGVTFPGYAPLLPGS